MTAKEQVAAIRELVGDNTGWVSCAQIRAILEPECSHQWVWITELPTGVAGLSCPGCWRCAKCGLVD